MIAGPAQQPAADETGAAYRETMRGIVAGGDLSASDAAAAIGAMMDGRWSPLRSAAFLAALGAKGETAAEVVGAVEAMRARMVTVDHALPLVVDTCGTGGHPAHTINVSTLAGLVVAGCGVPVAKHGNRGASSACGSADVLEAAGVALGEPAAVASRRLERDRFAFLFAQAYHPAMRAIGAVRRELGIRTIFNLLGPLANPARATHQVLGVASPAYLELLGEALRGLGVRAGAVVCARSGLDEVAGDVPTDVVAFDDRGVRRFAIDPADHGVAASQADLAGGSPRENALALRSVLEGERSPRASVVALNAALALAVAGHAGDIAEGLAAARASLRSGAALAALEALRRPVEMP